MQTDNEITIKTFVCNVYFITPLLREEKEEMTYDLQKAQDSVQKWKAHILRSVQQDKAKTEILEQLGPIQAHITLDWAMKFLPMKYRETQEEWYGQKGRSWHVSAVVTKDSDNNMDVGVLLSFNKYEHIQS